MRTQDEVLQDLLRRAAGGPANRELRRDLWPQMLQRFNPPRVRVPWWDWVVAAALLLWLLLFPEALPGVLCQL